MKSIFEEKTYKDLKQRLNNLDENTEPQWGKMNSGQMVWHCQAPLNIMLQKEDYGFKPNWLAKVFFKKSLYSEKPWKKGMPTAKALKAKDTKDFNTEKQKLEQLIEEAYQENDKTEWQPHPAFGFFTAEQWGKLQYKHLDHHFRQFGV